MHNLVKRQEASWRANSGIIANSMFGEDSIEISPSEADEIYDQSHLIERIENVEKEISTSSICTSAFKSDYFEHPALYRVLFMGSTNIQKLSQGFVHVLQHHRSNNHHAHPTAGSDSDIHSSSASNLFEQPITPFKEIKHNIILLSDDDAPELLSETCEDVGVSMIEADFTWNSNAIRFSNDPDNLLFKYAWDQCPNPRELPAAWMEDKIKDYNLQVSSTPNGIDLCVYFYDEYKVRCLDLGNLEVGQEPSFQKRQQNVTQYDQVGRLQVMECTQLNVPRVATYQILAVDQFCAIENKSIFELLKRTRERQQMLKVMKEQVMLRQQEMELEKEQSDSTSTSNSTSTITTPAATTTQSTQTYWYFDHYQFIKAAVVITLIVAVCSFAINKYRSTRWTAEFQVKPDFNFTVQTRNSKGLSNWSSVQPQVWMNDQHLIPIKRVDGEPGMYDLLIDFDQISNQPIVQLAFTVNTSLNQLSYTTAGSSNACFVILNPKLLRQQQDPPSQTQQQNESHQNTIPQQQQQQQEQQQQQQHSQQLNAKHTLKSLKFFTTNTIQNIIKIVWID
ncbi:hypothetical protein V8B55DRAFT_1462423 [Mucor lusitanicus]